jgi:acetoin utilization protein AcuB
MVVSQFMTKNPAVVHTDAHVNEVKELMSHRNIGKLPVLDKSNKLVGIVTKKDLKNAAPSGATTLDMYEISYLLSKLKVEKIMTKKVLTVRPDEVVEEAARMMADNGIGCLPVMDEDILLGIITESDLFHVFVDLFAARKKGVRITFNTEEKPGVLAKITQEIFERGGNIVSLVTGPADDAGRRLCACKIEGVAKDDIQEIFQTALAFIVDIR